ncbi:MAG: GspE/PulE family protein [Patescibacteria group bacterium]
MGEVIIPQETYSLLKEEVKNVLALKAKIEANLTKPITELIQLILAGAIILESSDLHIEPEEESAKMRLRMDGILQDIISFDLKLYRDLLSRLKLISGVKLNVADRPQDGRFSILAQETEIEARVSTLPAEYGEAFVLRLLNPKSLIEIEALGMRPDLLAIIKKEIKRPNGMFIVTGPTGCGKSTTLYAVLKKIQSQEVKIITIEDPIEYHLAGLSQTQVNPAKGYDFADGLKSIMRQDPDVILVGEIRDKETSEIALQASLTGHLVLSTLHTNNAAGAVARLMALGVAAANIAPALNLSLAQRLIRKVCAECSEMKPATAEELEIIKHGLAELPKIVQTPNIKPGQKIPHIRGCEQCNNTGYRGRIGIFEILVVDDEIEKAITDSPSAVDLEAIAKKKGMTTVNQDGLLKVLAGVTTLEEVERVTGEN